MAAAATPGLTAWAGSLISQFGQRNQGRSLNVLELALDFAGIDADEFTRRCESNPLLEDLVVKVLRATSNTALRGKIIAFGVSLGNGLVPDIDDFGLAWERSFVRAMDNLDASHLIMLDRFTWTNNQLGLGDGSPAFDGVPDQIGEAQMEVVAKGLVNLPELIATLESSGLVASRARGGAAVLGGGGASHYWSLTQFGQEALERLAAIREMFGSQRPESG